MTPKSTETTGSAASAPNLAYIDCLRGYAIFLVMCCHTAYAYPELPYPVHRTAAFGWHGVQLFFLASCVTLMMSAQREIEKSNRLDIPNFFIRRFLRIAPMYYTGALIYWIAWKFPNAPLWNAAASLLFVNSWHPVTMSTVPNGWAAVPGGWSIGVEFTFYFLFPIFMAWVTSLKRALAGFAGAIIIAVVANSLLKDPLTSAYGETAADNFLYFWFFNQAPVFFLGSVVFFLMKKIKEEPTSLLGAAFGRRSSICAYSALAVLAGLAATTFPFGHHFLAEPAVPKFLLASLAFAAFMLALSQMKQTVLINPLAASLGKVSFSAYVLHFAVIDLLLHGNARLFHLDATSWSAIAAFVLGLAAVTVVTFVASSVTYRLIEAPFMAQAKRLTSARMRVASSVPVSP